MANSIEKKQLRGVRWNAATRRFDVTLQRGCYGRVFIGSYRTINEVEIMIAAALKFDDTVHMPCYTSAQAQAQERPKPPAHKTIADILTAELTYLEGKK